MILGNQSTEIQSEIQYEVKTTEIKDSVNKSFTCVNIREILKQESAKDQKSNTEIFGDKNNDKAVTNIEECGSHDAVENVHRLGKGDTNVRKDVQGHPRRKKRPAFPTGYWIQFSHVETETDSPLVYEPDRNSFVALVFAIDLLMVISSANIVALVYTIPELRDIFLSEQRYYILICATVGMLMLNYIIMCCSFTRRFPCNILVLSIAVMLMSTVASFATVAYSTDLILLALTATAITLLSCLLLALTEVDFTKLWLYVFALSVTFTVLAITISLLAVFTNIRYRPFDLIILFVGASLNIIVIVMELQSILGGKTVELNADDYALAAYMLYTSIINLYIKVLSILGYFLDDEFE